MQYLIAVFTLIAVSTVAPSALAAPIASALSRVRAACPHP